MHIYLLQVLYLFLFLISFFLYDIFYLLSGNPELFLKDYDTIKSYEHVLFSQISLMAEPYVLATLVLILLFSLYFIMKVKMIKKVNFKLRLLCFINTSILFFYIITLAATFISFTISNGILG